MRFTSRRLATLVLLGPVSALTAAVCVPEVASGPQVVSLLLTALFGAVLHHHRTTGARHLWCLPLLMVAWVHLAGGYVVGLALVAITCAGEAIHRALARRDVAVDGVAGDEPSRAIRIFAPFSARDARGERVRWLALTGVACLLAAGVSPSAGGFLGAPLRDLALRFPPSLPSHEPPAPSVIAFLALWAATLIVIAVSPRRRNVTDLLLFAALTAAAAAMSWGAAAFAVVMAPILVRHADARWTAGARPGSAVSV